jgi:uncharacterized protein with HEPN domain
MAMRDLSRDQLIAELRQLRPQFGREGVVGMVLFGSRARGDNRPGSDVDLAVEVDEGRKFSLFDLIGVGHLIKDRTGLDANLFMRRSDRPHQRGLARIRHIEEAIAVLRGAIAGRTFEAIRKDKLVWAGLQRYLEIISEACRHIPEEWKLAHGPNVPWRNIGDLGKHRRHEYHKTDDAILWDTYVNDLAPLEAAIAAMRRGHSS